ncbi:MAG TPA: amidohydrolase, partial [Alphaproteobacteria bacterium]
MSGLARWAWVIGVVAAAAAPARAADYDAAIAATAAAIEGKVIAWRRDIHQNPELGNREVRTAALVADHLRGLGFDEVRTGIAHTGVVGILRGGL